MKDSQSCRRSIVELPQPLLMESPSPGLDQPLPEPSWAPSSSCCPRCAWFGPTRQRDGAGSPREDTEPISLTLQPLRTGRMSTRSPLWGLWGHEGSPELLHTEGQHPTTRLRYGTHWSSPKSSQHRTNSSPLLSPQPCTSTRADIPLNQLQSHLTEPHFFLYGFFF